MNVIWTAWISLMGAVATLILIAFVYGNFVDA